MTPSYCRPLRHPWTNSPITTFAVKPSPKRSHSCCQTLTTQATKTNQEHDMTQYPPPRIAPAWDWLIATHSTKSSYRLILVPPAPLLFIVVVMVLSASSVEHIAGLVSFALLRSRGVYAVIGVALLFWMGKWRRETCYRLARLMLLAAIALIVW